MHIFAHYLRPDLKFAKFPKVLTTAARTDSVTAQEDN